MAETRKQITVWCGTELSHASRSIKDNTLLVWLT
jgi:hypothetical protein